jgi:chromosome segregation ATPase
MLGILGNIKLIIGTAVAVAMLGVGYKIGARQVDALEAEIKTIKNEGDSEEARRKRAQVEIDKALAAASTEHARQMEQLKAEGERKAKELDAALAGKDSRIAGLQAQMSVNKSREAKLSADMAKASPAERASLVAQIEQLRTENVALARKADANECLVLAVPEAVIGPLVK